MARLPKAKLKKNFNKTKESVTKSQKAGLTLSVARIYAQIKRKNPGCSIQQYAPVYLAAVAEKLLIEIIDLAAYNVMKNKRKRIMPLDIFTAIQKDRSIKNLLGDRVLLSHVKNIIDKPHLLLYPNLNSNTRIKSKK